MLILSSRFDRLNSMLAKNLEIRLPNFNEMKAFELVQNYEYYEKLFKEIDEWHNKNKFDLTNYFSFSVYDA